MAVPHRRTLTARKRKVGSRTSTDMAQKSTESARNRNGREWLRIIVAVVVFLVVAAILALVFIAVLFMTVVGVLMRERSARGR